MKKKLPYPIYYPYSDDLSSWKMKKKKKKRLFHQRIKKKMNFGESEIWTYFKDYKSRKQRAFKYLLAIIVAFCFHEGEFGEQCKLVSYWTTHRFTVSSERSVYTKEIFFADGRKHLSRKPERYFLQRGTQRKPCFISSRLLCARSRHASSQGYVYRESFEWGGAGKKKKKEVFDETFLFHVMSW